MIEYMNDRFEIIPLKELLKIILQQLNNKKNILEIQKALFFIPKKNDPFRLLRFGQLLETPLGVAAGPHTQLAQNIVAAWLTGARFIELKTVQTLDRIEVSKPCIDMQDEGYNCEWSQELRLQQSFDQYLNAWIIIHILKYELGYDLSELGFIFNMSVGYDYEGIMQDNVQWFLNKMENATVELNQKIEEIKPFYPNISSININPKLSNNITLSTMHGCPPHEIEKIALYFLTEKKFHTTIKLNPTLLGKEKLYDILTKSGFNTKVPDIAFEHDLKYDDALNIINNLKAKATSNGLFFGLKLTNTLESLNNKDVFSKHENTMYMSGRALHPIAINLAARLQNDFNGQLNISFSGGADAFNMYELLSSGLTPVTVCSDILKPGGYGRFHQYIKELRKVFNDDTDDNTNYIKNKITANSTEKKYLQQLDNLNRYAKKTLSDVRYKNILFHAQSIKTNRLLSTFDCIKAPCVNTCPTNQDIPDYMYHTAKGDFKKAFEVIMRTNPFPNTTGMICDHICTSKCTRIDYDAPLHIREIKRFVAEYAVKNNFFISPQILNKTGKIAIIGAGPSGLSAAWFLLQAGFEVDVYETKSHAGGMVTGAIPSFRLTGEASKIDILRIKKLGAKIYFNTNVNNKLFNLLYKSNDAIYIATGAQNSRKLAIEGIDNTCVIDPLDFLFNVKHNPSLEMGRNIAIIGGGNTAIDAARTAFRLTDNNGKVTVLYRRTIKDMPADIDEIKAALDEGINIEVLVSPIKIVKTKNNSCYITLIRMHSGKKDKTGRAYTLPIAGSEFKLEFDTIIPAIGQESSVTFLTPKLLKTKMDSYETQLENVFVGGDALRGASTVINAVADGRKAANEIIKKIAKAMLMVNKPKRISQNLSALMVKKTAKIVPVTFKEKPLNKRKNFNLVTTSFTEQEAIYEASRCLLCDEVCNICTTVCPNIAFHSFKIQPIQFKIWKINVSEGKAKIVEDEDFEIKQKYQILHIADWCNECGNCVTFCPTAGKPYRDKPHLYLKKESFENNKDGYYINKKEKTLEYFYYGNKLSFKEIEAQYILKSDSFNINIDKIDFKISALQIKKEITFEFSLKIAAEMSIILQGAKSFYGDKIFEDN